LPVKGKGFEQVHLSWLSRSYRIVCDYTWI